MSLASRKPVPFGDSFRFPSSSSNIFTRRPPKEFLEFDIYLYLAPLKSCLLTRSPLTMFCNALRRVTEDNDRQPFAIVTPTATSADPEDLSPWFSRKGPLPLALPEAPPKTERPVRQEVRQRHLGKPTEKEIAP